MRSKPALHPGRSGRTEKYSVVVDDRGTTHVLVPVEDYEKLVLAEMALESIALLENAKDKDFVDADDLGIVWARDAVVAARKKAGLTQKQLGAKIGVPQSMISRIEKNPDRTTVRTLRKVAKALRVHIGTVLKHV